MLGMIKTVNLMKAILLLLFYFWLLDKIRFISDGTHLYYALPFLCVHNPLVDASTYIFPISYRLATNFSFGLIIYSTFNFVVRFGIICVIDQGVMTRPAFF